MLYTDFHSFSRLSAPAFAASDLIGDACEEQIVKVQFGGSPDISISVGMADFLQPLNQLAALTIDFSNAVSCDWVAESCTLIEANIEVCVGESLGATGC